jgi:hypothetical protein
MGSGVALAVKNTYPKAYEAYKSFEKLHGLRLASSSTVAILNKNHKIWVSNLITQETYGRDKNTRYVSYGAIHLGFENLHSEFDINVPFHFPKIGAGLGNGNWDVISGLIHLACPNRELVCWEL